MGESGVVGWVGSRSGEGGMVRGVDGGWVGESQGISGVSMVLVGGVGMGQYSEGVCRMGMCRCSAVLMAVVHGKQVAWSCAERGGGLIRGRMEESWESEGIRPWRTQSRRV